jgi:hypothetical protein
VNLVDRVWFMQMREFFTYILEVEQCPFAMYFTNDSLMCTLSGYVRGKAHNIPRLIDWTKCKLVRYDQVVVQAGIRNLQINFIVDINRANGKMKIDRIEISRLR